MKKIKILGYSGHSYEILDILINNDYRLEGYFDIKKNFFNPFNLTYLGNENEKAFEKKIKDNNFFVSIGKNSKRSKISKFIVDKGGILVNAIHHTSSISNQVKIGYGNFLSKNTCVNYNSILKNNIIVNTAAIVEHDCIVESNTHVGPGVVLCGGVIVKQGTFIGANSVVKENVEIGRNVIVGAGSVVIKNIPDNALVYGNPAKIFNE